jgi:hypothetical protein
MQTLLTIIAIISIPGAIWFTRYMIAEGNNIKQEYEKPVLKIKNTIVPQSFLEKFKVWDENLYENKTIINDEV